MLDWAGRDRRRHRRYPCADHFRVRPLPDGAWTRARLLDISLSGCAARLEAALRLQPGTLVELRFGSQYFAFSTLAEVRHTSDAEPILRACYHQLSTRATADILAYARDQQDLRITRLLESARLAAR